MNRNNIFDARLCAKDIIEVLQRHNATFSNMKEVFKLVKKDVSLKTSIHTDGSTQ